MQRLNFQTENDRIIEDFLGKLSFSHRKKLGPGIALFEFQTHLIGHAAYSFFIHNCISEGLRPICFSMQEVLSLKSRIAEKMRFKLRLDTIPSRPYYVLNQMNIEGLVQVVKKTRTPKQIRAIVKPLLGTSKEKILQLNYQGIIIGDLFYDWHLSKRRIPTLDSSSKIFEQDLTEFLVRAKSWDNYFKKNPIRMVVVTHAVYLQGLVVRTGLKYKAKVFLVTPEKLHQFSEDMFLADSESIYYNTSNEFKLGYSRNQESARHMLSELKAGSTKVDVAHSYVNGMSGQSKTHIIKKNSNVRILIAAHCFSDSPHTNGIHLFPDFVEWLNWLGEISLKTDYEWYVKQHPAFFPSDYIVLEEFCSRFPNVKLVEHTYSNIELINQGINVVLTVYGTIAFEAASLGALVINASRFSPHVNFNFSKSPLTLSEYHETLVNLENIMRTWVVQESSILHFYDIHHLRRNFNWLFQISYSELTSEFGVDYQDPFELLKFFTARMNNTELHSKIQLGINSFMASSKYVLGRLD